jgi:hypothetical protein
VTGGVTVFRAENWANLIYPLEIGSDTHLLRQLRGLSKECLTAEIIDLKNAGARFRSTTLKLGGVDFDEPLSIKVRTEQIADT